MAVGRLPGPAAPGADAPAHAGLRTGDMDEAREFCRRLYYGRLEIEPVGDPGRLEFSADVAAFGPVTLGEIRYGTDIRISIGALETAYHVLVPLSGRLRSQHRGTVSLADPTRALVYRPTGDIELEWPATCHLMSVKVERAALERELDAALDQRVVSPLPLGTGFDLVDGPGRTWSALARLLLRELITPGTLSTSPRMAARWRDMVVSGLALTVEHPYGEEPAGLQGPLRPRTVKRALDAMHAEPRRGWTTRELSTVAGVGVRVLQESFRQHVGMSPLTYLRRLRLDGVHADLSRCDPGQTNVSEVAYGWGFTHLGRFAGAYRSRFGTTPSQTLRNRL
ncbi:AraC family transcriptional regulator [Actinoplanes sp. G11-F43]|uniref:AraC family transcriptional regulator n=1 Tax=Actinoplanes sp. G11-F43 TaxID=3424130 RepID=UPI003D356632